MWLAATLEAIAIPIAPPSCWLVFSNPDASQPLASIAVGDPVDGPVTGCAECHSGIHHPFVEEWALSPHANVVESAASNPSCVACHSAQGTLEAWGENADYLEKDGAPLPVAASEYPGATKWSSLAEARAR